MTRLLSALPLLAAFALALPAQAAEPCGGINLSSGSVAVGQPLPVTATLAGDAASCVAAIGAALQARPGLRTVTVAVRLPDGERLDGSGIAVANAYVQALVAAGLSASRVSAVAPAARPGDAASVGLAYTEKKSTQPVALVESAGGSVLAGGDLSSLEAVRGGAMLPAGTYVRTSGGGNVALGLADGSRLRLPENTTLLLVRLFLNEELRREVELELREGSIEAHVSPGGDGSNFQVNTRTGVAGVRGTEFRLALDGDEPLRIETYEGLVAVSAQGQEPVEVPGGTATSISSAGTIAAPSELLAAPGVKSPLYGEHGRRDKLKWSGVKGAKSYTVQLARDAEFTLSVQALDAAAAASPLPGDLGPGKWFWRVVGRDGDGATGVPSKIYAFTVAD